MAKNRVLASFTPELVLETDEEKYQKKYNKMMDDLKAYTATLVKSRVTTHQIRNIFSGIIKAQKPLDLWKLQVNLAYIAGRNERNFELKDFTEHLSMIIRAVKTPEQLDLFKEFFKALVAYHKYNEKFGNRR